MFDWSFVQRYAPFFVKGMEMTLFISIIGIILALVVGLICAGVELARVPVARQIVRVYIEISRNTPLLVQLYFLFFGLPKLGIVWSAETCAIVGLGFLGGSYMAEAMRDCRLCLKCSVKPRTCWDLLQCNPSHGSCCRKPSPVRFQALWPM